MVMMPNRLMASMPFSFSPTTFLVSTLRLWNVTLAPRAENRPAQLNVGSVKEASMTPRTIGTSESSTIGGVLSPRKMLLSTTEKNGSIALTVCVKLTATLPSDTFVMTFPSVCTTASGKMAAICARVTVGGSGCSRNVQSTAATHEPTTNCRFVMVTGNGNMFSTCLLYMLYQMLNPYQRANSIPSTRVACADRSTTPPPPALEPPLSAAAADTD
mmetsp:Transcript_7615/g.17342  ORF Transcript_7615/g.17342 Transcript_7615/m.17342 type:complete len:215 (+) Transcript_7615:637-1281(+)